MQGDERDGGLIPQLSKGALRKKGLDSEGGEKKSSQDRFAQWGIRLASGT